MTFPFLQLDHLILTASDLATGMDYVENILGVRPVYSGQHLGLGTHNALLSLGNRMYFEVIAPDPTQDIAAEKLWIDIPAGYPPRLSMWVAQASSLQMCGSIARIHQIPLGAVNSGTRTQADGTQIHWQATNPAVENFDGLIPFFIDWGDSPHPSEQLPSAGSLEKIVATHPEAARMSGYWEAFGIPYEVEEGEVAGLRAWIRTNGGEVVVI